MDGRTLAGLFLVFTLASCETEVPPLSALYGERCPLVVVAAVPVDAWGGQHHVSGKLLLATCKADRRLYSRKMGAAAKHRFEQAVASESFLVLRVCRAFVGDRVDETLQRQVVDAANEVAGSRVIRGLGCQAMGSAEHEPR